jgi:vancomycin permeability regulator SanA
MRYVISMVSAAVAALLAMLLLASPVATWAVDRMTFNNPDSVGDAHAMIFMVVNFAALAIGWGIGWMIGGAFDKDGRTGV